MKRFAVLVACCLIVTAVPLLCSGAASQSSYSSYQEYLSEQEHALKSFSAGNIWSDCSKCIK